MPEKILIIDDDLDTLRLVGLMLQKQGYVIAAAPNGTQGLAKAFEERPDLILLDVMMPDMDGYEVTRRLRKNPATESTPILMFTAKTQLDDKVSGFEVGADDYLTKPTHPNELQAHIRALLERNTKKHASDIKTAAREHFGYVIGVVSARGGLGVTSVALNLAAGIFSRVRGDVILAEMTPGHGTLAMDMGIPPQKGLSDMLNGSVVEITREKAQSSLFTHISGMKMLLASETPSDVVLTSRVENYKTILARMATLARFIVLDLGDGLPKHTQELLAMCNERFVVVEGVPNTIRQTKMLINEMVDMKIERSSIYVLLNNRIRSESQMPMAQVQDSLGHSVTGTLTPAPELFLQAVKLQTPAVISQPSNITAQQFLKIADMVIEREKTR